MANRLDRQILEEGHRNVVVRFVGTLDEGDLLLDPALDLSDTSGGDPNRTLAGFAGGEVEFSCSADLQVRVLWKSADPQPMWVLSDTGCAGDVQRQGWSYPDRTAEGYDGSLAISTSGFNPGSTAGFTLTLRLKKVYST